MLDIFVQQIRLIQSKVNVVYNFRLSETKQIYLYDWKLLLLKILRWENKKVFDAEIDMEIGGAIKYEPGLIKYKD